MARRGNKRVSQLVDTLVQIGTRVITDQVGADEKTAHEAATQIATHLCFQYASQQLYVPALIELRLSERDKQIYEEYGQDGVGTRRFTVARIDELSVKYKLTQRQLYSIFQLAKIREIEARQGHLPGIPQPDPR